MDDVLHHANHLFSIQVNRWLVKVQSIKRSKWLIHIIICFGFIRRKISQFNSKRSTFGHSKLKCFSSQQQCPGLDSMSIFLHKCPLSSSFFLWSDLNRVQRKTTICQHKDPRESSSENRQNCVWFSRSASRKNKERHVSLMKNRTGLLISKRNSQSFSNEGTNGKTKRFRAGGPSPIFSYRTLLSYAGISGRLMSSRRKCLFLLLLLSMKKLWCEL